MEIIKGEFKYHIQEDCDGWNSFFDDKDIDQSTKDHVIKCYEEHGLEFFMVTKFKKFGCCEWRISDHIGSIHAANERDALTLSLEYFEEVKA